jgi:TupA-like ATPgrasp
MLKAIRKFGLRHLRKMRFLPPKLYVKILYEYFTGKKLDLNNPKEFNAKIQWYKVFYHPKILNTLVDKYEVRSYVAEKIGEQYLNEIYGVYENAEDIPFDELPKKFVVKATHTSSHNLIVTNKEKLNKPKARKLFKKWLGKNQYYRIGQEWAYKDVQPRLLVEKFMAEDGKSSLVDYKFYCFDGKAKLIDVHSDRNEDHKQGIFDLDFNLMPFGKGSKKRKMEAPIEKPSNLEEMIRLSEKLSQNLPFVRVDFYSINGASIFGEMTFYPADGRKDFFPDKYNRVVGDYFKLPELKNGTEIITKFNHS